MQVLIAGHSFVRRLAFDVRIKAVKIAEPHEGVELVGKGGATIGPQKPLGGEVHSLLRRQPSCKLLILDLGSNDLDTTRHPHLDVQLLAIRYLQLGDEFAKAYKITVVLCLPIPRDEKQFPGSFQTTSKFNDAMRLFQAHFPQIKLWAHRGLFKKDARFLDRHGVHLNAMGSIRYYHSLKAAVRYHMSRV